MIEVKDIDIEEVEGFEALLRAYFEMGGFTAKQVGLAAEILGEMFVDEDCTVFLSFTGDVIATGLRGVFKTLVKRGLVDIVITTVGTLDHDLARCWRPYYQGDFTADDEKLFGENIQRLGNVFIPRESYGEILEEKLRPFLENLWQEGKKELSTHELCKILGERVACQESILHWAAERDIPLIIPGPLDGAVGSQLWLFQQSHRGFRIDLFKDQELLSNVVFEAKRTGAMIVGGGISKHHLLWWNQFRGGCDYAVQITTAVERDGSLSGARLDEAVSWGKVSKKARRASVWGEATVVLPVVVKAALERVERELG
ncbi:MAG: deoxyhypusine synthase [Candidatus Geothermarchaeales archaeon]